jgi:putative salt-induced outer membrane protein
MKSPHTAVIGPAGAAVFVAALYITPSVPLLAQAPAPSPAQAQSPPPPPPPREGTAEVSFVGTTGNAPTSALGLGGEYISRRPAPWELRGKVGYVRNTSEDVLQAEAFRLLFRGSRTITDRLSAFGQYGYLRDRFAGIESRNTADGGITYAVLRPRPHQLDVDAAIGYANEKRVLGDDISSPQALLGARYKFFLSDTSDITDDVAFTASFSDSSDWRTSNTVALTAKITTILSLKLSNAVRFVNAPAEGFETTDTLTSIALVAKF